VPNGIEWLNGLPAEVAAIAIVLSGQAWFAVDIPIVFERFSKSLVAFDAMGWPIA
jgi:hypothetical protein